jgi:hypothetical protein
MSDLLTTSEVSELVEGTPVTITWSGGNGPHDYVIAVEPNHICWPGVIPHPCSDG